MKKIKLGKEKFNVIRNDMWVRVGISTTNPLWYNLIDSIYEYLRSFSRILELENEPLQRDEEIFE